ncbi:MAG: aminotransferase class V-fold PLP-dependent enzyme [bacterium]|nr:aminotransferase class V-fold PLP-dependent enzyme [bacterium]
MSLPRSFLDHYDEPFGFVDFAAIGAMSIPARRRLASMAEVMAGRTEKLVPFVMGELGTTAALAARLLRTDPGRVGIVPNTSTGLFTVAFGLPRGSVVVPETEFPANLYPWTRAAEAGRIELRMVEVQAGRLTADLVADAVDTSTVAVAASYVDYHTGFRCDLASLREAAGDALLVIDAVQGQGALEFSMEHVDVAVAAGHKWLRAGGGVGVMAVSDRALERLSPTLVGWPGVEDPFDVQVPLPHPPLSDAGRFTMGSPPFTAVAALRGSLEALGEVPMEDVERAVIARSKSVEEEVLAAGAVVLCPPLSDSERSGIVTFRPSGESSADAYARLTEAGFFLTERGGYLRVAPHASTHPDAAAALGEILRTRGSFAT